MRAGDAAAERDTFLTQFRFSEPLSVRTRTVRTRGYLVESAAVDRYLTRLGVEEPPQPNYRSLERLQRTHVQTVPFETLSITGDPHGDRDGEGVILDRPTLSEKLLDHHRGGFCYELNGMFGWLLTELGYDADRLAASVIIDGDPRPPANHLTTLVHLDRPYVVDVGMGAPQMRKPLPLDGTVREDAVGVEWRIVESERPDADSLSQYRRLGDEEWSDRYVFTDTPREMTYFEATCDYLQRAPESPFTGDPVAVIGTEDGWAKLSPETYTRVENGEERERKIIPGEYHDLLESQFGVRYKSNE